MLEHEAAHLRKYLEYLAQLLFLNAPVQVLEITDFPDDQAKSSFNLFHSQFFALWQVLNGGDSRQSRVPPALIVVIQRVEKLAKLLIAHG